MSTESTTKVIQKLTEKELKDTKKIESNYLALLKTQEDVLDKFYEIETDLDQEQIPEDIEYFRRRKKWMARDFDFKRATPAECNEDLEAIFGFVNDSSVLEKHRSLKKNDLVFCVVDRKRYKGIIFQINNDGLVIKTKDRKRIRIAWDTPEEYSIQLVKARNLSN